MIRATSGGGPGWSWTARRQRSCRNTGQRPQSAGNSRARSTTNNAVDAVAWSRFDGALRRPGLRPYMDAILSIIRWRIMPRTQHREVPPISAANSLPTPLNSAAGRLGQTVSKPFISKDYSPPKRQFSAAETRFSLLSGEFSTVNPKPGATSDDAVLAQPLHLVGGDAA